MFRGFLSTNEYCVDHVVVSITIGPHHNKKDGKDQETIQSSTTLDPGYHMGKNQK